MLSEKINNVLAGIIRLRRSVVQSFFAFRDFYFKESDRKPDGECQKEICSLLTMSINNRGVRIAIAAPRGFAKSTIIEEFVMYCVVHKLEKFIVIISATQDQSEEHLRNIKMAFEANDRLRNDFPVICATDKKDSVTRWAQDEIIFPNGVRVLALSTGKQIRGRRHGESRPSLIILDDIELNESVRNPESACKLEDWLTKAVLKSGSSHTNVVFAGTIHHHNSLLAKFTDPQQMPGWTSRRYKAVLAYAERVDLWEKWIKILMNNEDYDNEFGPDAARKFYEDNEAEMLRGVKLLWPEHKTYYEYMLIRAREGEYSFDSEYQNEPINSRDVVFDPRDGHNVEEMWGCTEKLLQARRKHILIFGSCDPCVGKNRETGDFSAIAIVALDTQTGTMYVLDVYAARCTLSQTIDKILHYCKIWEISRFGIECNGFQILITRELRQRAEALDIRVPFEEIQNTSNKQDRIEALQPMIHSGRLVISKKQRVLIEEMRYFPKGNHDDALDALEMAVSLAIRRGHVYSKRFWSESY